MGPGRGMLGLGSPSVRSTRSACGVRVVRQVTPQPVVEASPENFPICQSRAAEETSKTAIVLWATLLGSQIGSEPPRSVHVRHEDRPVQKLTI